ncbi:MAG: hypothetical protein ACOX52_24000 [Verrucomicrobiota bacterium]
MVSDQSDHCPNRNSEIGIEIEIETIPVQYGTSPSEQHSTLTAACCQHRNNTVS